MSGRRRFGLHNIMRFAIVAVVSGAGVLLIAAVLPGFSVDGFGPALLVSVAVAIVNCLVWPALRWAIAPIGVLTLGLGALVVNALLVGLAMNAMPGVEVDDLWAAIVITAALTLLSSVVWSLASLDDDEWFDRRTAQAAARKARKAAGPPIDDGAPGLVVVQLDGLALPVLERAMRSGDAPTLSAWRSSGHQLVGWTPEWSCQTGVSQCGILQGDVSEMPAFRWMDKSTGRIIVSNHPKDAAFIEQAHSSTSGLLAHHGSSYGNLFTGGATRAALTMSVAGTKKENRIGAGYLNYFAQPYQAFRTFIRVIAEIGRERVAASDQRRRDVQPRVDRDMTYALLRAFTTIISRDVSLAGVLNDMAEGRSIIYVDFLGYDEVAHHSGPERHDTLRVVRGLDRDLARIDRARQWCSRPYEIVVLSDHGQTQGATFRDRYGETLADVVARVTGGATTGRSNDEDKQTESTAILR
ncbi:MAG TPA: phage holin family protein, partial [Ilumatobacteraceae bacterium]|nr:phage holin family protein [Ilumatobacteraceae bacterium]